MKKRAVDLDVTELARFGREAAEEAAAAARARGLASFGAAEVAGDRVPSAEASAAKQPMRRRKTAGG